MSRHDEYPTGRLPWERLTAKMRDEVRHELQVARIVTRKPMTERRAHLRVLSRIAGSEALSRRAARRKAARRAVRAARRANR